MENASKALIIAGAILLSILIISLGLMVYNQAKETVGSVNLTQQEIEAFNSKFTSYEGTNVSGSKVNALIQTVISSNQAEVQAKTYKLIWITYGEDEDILEADNDSYNVNDYNRFIKEGKTYKVEFQYNEGLVYGIHLTDKN